MLVDRRTFLSTALSVSVGGVLALVLYWRRDEGRAARAQIELSSHFRDLSTIAVVGGEALKKLPEGLDAQRLLELVAPERGTEALRREIRDQYVRGETVELRGWSLALTEVRIYALVALGRDQS